MAIDPKLLVLKPVSELETVNNPTTGSLLFYDGGDKLKKTNVADFYNAMKSAYLGIATTATTPPATGAYWYRVDTAGTYTNFKDAANAAIVVSASDLNGNDVFLEVKDNVATKRVSDFFYSQIKPWSEASFDVGAEVSYKNALYKATSPTSPTDVPSLSDKWDLVVLGDFPCFYYSGKKPVSENMVKIASAIKDLKLVGDFDPRKNYMIHAIARNDTSQKYRFAIQELLSDNSYADGYVFDTGPIDVVEAGAGKTTDVTFSIPSLNRYVYATIDYNALPTTLLNVQDQNGLLIKPTNIFKDDISNANFIDFKFGNTVVPNHFYVKKAIKSIQLVGDFDVNKKYIISYIGKNHPNEKYRLELSSVDNNGLNPILVYDSGVFDLTEAGVGKVTHVDFGFVNSKKVILDIDYNELPTSIDLSTNLPNFVINNANIVDNEFFIQKNGFGRTTNGIIYESHTLLDKVKADYAVPSSMLMASKKGFMTFRGDDNYVDPEVISILDMYGVKGNIAVNLAILQNNNPNKLWGVAEFGTQQNFFRNIQARGHELCDHTPNHTANFFDFRKEYLWYFSIYVGNGISEIKDNGNGTYRALLSLVFDDYTNYSYGNPNSYSLVSGSGRINGDFSGFASMVSVNTKVQPTDYYLYIDNLNGPKIGWVCVKKENIFSGYAIATKWDGSAISFTANETISLYVLIPNYTNITLGDNATYCLILAGQTWAHYYGLKRFKTWVQPGGDHAIAKNESVEKALTLLGMVWAETADRIEYKTYNMTTNFPRTASDWDGGAIHLDEINESQLPTAKKMIADSIATRRLPTMATHFRWANFTGANDNEKKNSYLTYISNILRFCADNKIDFLTLEQRSELLNKAVTYKNENIFPPIYVDSNADGIPDGHDLGANATILTSGGMTMDKGYILKSTGLQQMTRIVWMGGWEKGRNVLSFYAKGNFRISGILQDGFNSDSSIAIASKSVDVNSTEWTRYEIEYDIPYDFRGFATFTLWINVLTSADAQVSGIRIKCIE